MPILRVNLVSSRTVFFIITAYHGSFSGRRRSGTAHRQDCHQETYGRRSDDRKEYGTTALVHKWRLWRDGENVGMPSPILGTRTKTTAGFSTEIRTGTLARNDCYYYSRPTAPTSGHYPYRVEYDINYIYIYINCDGGHDRYNRSRCAIPFNMADQLINIP